MVLEALITPQAAERKPYEMFFIGILYASMGVILSLWIFRSQASLVMVFLTVLACTPLIYQTIKLQTQTNKTEIFLLKEHAKALSFFMCLFLGFVFAFSAWYVFLPERLVQNLFTTQLTTIAEVNSRIIGFTTHADYFGPIFMNNIKVLLFCIFFSFFYGAGAIFILTWNASVISAAIGTFIRENISYYAAQFNLLGISNYFHIFSIGLMRYMTHGIPEILAYFIGGLSGGIISIAMIKHINNPENFKKVLYDSMSLFLIAVFLLAVAGLIEVFITPSLF